MSLLKSFKLLVKTRVVRSTLIGRARKAAGRCQRLVPDFKSGGDAPPPLAQIRSILVVRVDGIGDFILTTPLLRELRRAAPNARITLLVIPNVYELARSCPHVDRVIAIPRELDPDVVRSDVKRFAIAREFIRKNLGDEVPELAIVPRWDCDSHFGPFLACLSGARWRVGHSESANPRKQTHDRGYNRLYTDTIDLPGPRHEVQRCLDLLRHLGADIADDRLEVWPSPDDHVAAQRLLDEHGLGIHNTLFAFAMAAYSPKRRWPLERFVELARWCAAEHGAAILALGSAADRSLCESFRAAVGGAAFNLAGCANLGVSAALLARTRLFVGNDTGVTHLAAAAGVPLVALSCHPAGGDPYAVNAPERFAPWSSTAVVLRPRAAAHPCTTECDAAQAHCILDIQVNQVIAATASRFSRAVSSQPSPPLAQTAGAVSEV